MSKKLSLGVTLALVLSVMVAGCGGGGGGNGGTTSPSGFAFNNQGLTSETASTTMVSLDGLAFSDNGIDLVDPDVHMDHLGNAIITMVGQLPSTDAVLGTADDQYAVYVAYYNASTNKLQRPTQITGKGATYRTDPEGDADGAVTTRPSPAVVIFRSTSSSSDAANGDAVVVWAADRSTTAAADLNNNIFYTTFDRSAFLAAPTTTSSGWTTAATELASTFTDDNADGNDDEDETFEDTVNSFAVVSDNSTGVCEWFGDTNGGNAATKAAAGWYAYSYGSIRDNDDVRVPLTYTNTLGLVIFQEDTLTDAGSVPLVYVRGSVWSGSAFGAPSAIAIPEDTTLSAVGAGASAYTGGFCVSYNNSCFFDFTDGFDDDTADEADVHLAAVGGGTTTLSFAATATRISPTNADNSGATTSMTSFWTMVGPADGMNNILGFFTRDLSGTNNDTDLYWYEWNYQTGAQVGSTTAVTDGVAAGGDVTAVSGGGVSKDGDYAVVGFIQEDNAVAAGDNDQGAFLVDVPDSALGTAPTVGAAVRLDHNPAPADANGDINITGIDFMVNSVNTLRQYTSGAQSKDAVIAGTYTWNDTDSSANSTVEDVQGRFWRYTSGSVTGSTQAVVTGIDCNVTSVGGVAITDVADMEVADGMTSGTTFVAYIRQEDGTTTAPDAAANCRLYGRLFDSASSTSSMGSAVELGSGTGFNTTGLEVDVATQNTTKHFVTYLEDRDSTTSSTAVEDDTQVVRHRILSLGTTFAAAAFTPNPAATSSNRLTIDVGSASSTLTTTMVDANQSYVLMFMQSGRLYYSLNPSTSSVTVSQVTNPNAGVCTGLPTTNPLVCTLRGGDGTFFLLSTQTYGTYDRAYVRLLK